MKKKRIVIGCMTLTVLACKPVQEFRQVENDSVKVVREIVRDTTVIVSADSSWLRALLECDSTGQVILKELLDYQTGKNVEIPEITIKDNRLTAKTRIDSFGIFLQLRDRYETVRTDRVVGVKEVREVNRLKGWQKCLMGLGLLFLFLSGRYVWRFFRG